MAQKASSPNQSREKCPMIQIEIERLPDLNIPRAGHELFYVNGELVVAGGHTNGFVPTPTAEYYRNGKWNQLQMVYNHDVGFSVVLKSGKVLLAGGCDQPIGIGQTHLAELYDPVTHTFDGFSSMDLKRTLAAGLEMDNGQVVIAGNWYHKDGIEVFNGQKKFTYIKDATVERSHPYILRTSKSDVIIFGMSGIRGDTISCAVADRLEGDTIHLPLFESWHLLPVSHHRPAESFIGDETKNLYAYLIPVQDSTGQVAIAKAENGNFSLLPTVCPIPMRSQWENIEYYTPVFVDQKAGRGYIMGSSRDDHSNQEKAHRFYLLCIDYAHATESKPAPLTLYYTDTLSFCPDNVPVFDHEGNLLMAGGLLDHSNFTPSAAAYLLRIAQSPTTIKAGNNWQWLLTLLISTILIAAFLIIYLILHRRKHHRALLEQEFTDDTDDKPYSRATLIQNIRKLVESQELYRKSDLKVSDIATMLGTNSRYISDCINSCEGCTFSNFINRYRINYVQEIMRHHPERKISTVYMEAGFSNETSFFRTFKALTDMTPKEWMEKID